MMPTIFKTAAICLSMAALAGGVSLRATNIDLDLVTTTAVPDFTAAPTAAPTAAQTATRHTAAETFNRMVTLIGSTMGKLVRTRRRGSGRPNGELDSNGNAIGNSNGGVSHLSSKRPNFLKSNFCFPSAATTMLSNGQTVAMEALKVGDEVLTERGYSRIYAFGHDDITIKQASYIQISTAANTTLLISPEHILPLDGQMDFAKKAVVGMQVTLANGKRTTVTSLRVVERNGAHAPFTLDGTIVVDGILASSFSFTPSLTLGGVTVLTGHSVGTMWTSPLRLMSRFAPWIGSDDWHNAEGQHMFVQWLFSVVYSKGRAEAMSQSGALPLTAGTLPQYAGICVCGMISVVDHVVHTAPAYAATIALGVLTVPLFKVARLKVV